MGNEEILAEVEKMKKEIIKLQDEQRPFKRAANKIKKQIKMMRVKIKDIVKPKTRAMKKDGTPVPEKKKKGLVVPKQGNFVAKHGLPDMSVVQWLQFHVKSYDDIVKTQVRLKNRSQAYHLIDILSEESFDSMEEAKMYYSKMIKKQLEFFPIWTEWMVNITGCGPVIAGNLILMFYYRSHPICSKCGQDLPKPPSQEESKKAQEAFKMKCPDCGTEAKGGGLLEYRMEYRDWANPSKWIWNQGIGVDPATGKKQKRRKGVQSNWTPVGSTIHWQLGQQFNLGKENQGNFYKDWMVAKKKKLAIRLPDSTTPKHLQKQAEHQTTKIFAHHMWHVARSLMGLSTVGPYIEVYGGHTNIIPPPHWEE